MDATSPDFHGKPGHRDDPACFTCHAKAPPATGTAFTCAKCHTNVASGDWRTACNACHGSPTSDGPPRDLLGNTATSFVGVGAHQSHLQGTHGVAAPLDCTACHPKPTAALMAPHLDGRVEVTGYTGSDPALLAAVLDPGWNRAIPSCTTSYCHGATLGGGTAVQPVWTRVDGSQVACGSCHGLPPPGHMTVPPPVTAASCAACHPATVKTDGAIDAAGGKHVNGTVETEGIRGHGAGWHVPGDPASHGRVAVEDGLDSCFRCHSAKEPSTNGIRTCASCHDALAGGGDWTTSCVGCHGSGTSSAPPKDVHGNTATTAIGVGAHRSHVEATSGIAQKYDCSVCHQKPSVVFSPGHLDGSTTVTGYTGDRPEPAIHRRPGLEPDERDLLDLLVSRRVQRDVHLHRGRRVGRARARGLRVRREAQHADLEPGGRHPGDLRDLPRGSTLAERPLAQRPPRGDVQRLQPLSPRRGCHGRWVHRHREARERGGGRHAEVGKQVLRLSLTAALLDPRGRAIVGFRPCASPWSSRGGLAAACSHSRCWPPRSAPTRAPWERASSGTITSSSSRIPPCGTFRGSARSSRVPTFSRAASPLPTTVRCTA